VGVGERQETPSTPGTFWNLAGRVVMKRKRPPPATCGNHHPMATVGDRLGGGGSMPRVGRSSAAPPGGRAGNVPGSARARSPRGERRRGGRRPALPASCRGLPHHWYERVSLWVDSSGNLDQRSVAVIVLPRKRHRNRNTSRSHLEGQRSSRHTPVAHQQTNPFRT